MLNFCFRVCCVYFTKSFDLLLKQNILYKLMNEITGKIPS